ncbi:MAG: hypothetical protein QW265_05035 [Candidatus Bathyarchaeia archaeon]
MKSLEELTPEEKIDILANYIRYLLAAQAGMVMPLVEKYGDEAKDYLKRSLRLKFKERFKRIFDAKKVAKRDLNAFRESFWESVLLPLAIIGQRGGMVVEATDKKLVTRDTRCIELESWKEMTDKPEIMCEIDAEIAFAMAEAINPKLKYTKYSGDKIKGKTDWGLPYGKPYCEFIVELED